MQIPLRDIAKSVRAGLCLHHACARDRNRDPDRWCIAPYPRRKKPQAKLKRAIVKGQLLAIGSKRGRGGDACHRCFGERNIGQNTHGTAHILNPVQDQAGL